WQRYQPLLVALADDAQHLVGPINGADLQRGGLADAQTTRIHDGKARLVDRVADTAEEMTDLIFRQRVRQPLLPWRGDPFFPRTVTSLGRAYDGRGNAGVLTGFEGAARHSSLSQPEQVAPHLFLAEFIG